MKQDRRGIPVSCSNQRAMDLYEKALMQYQSYVGDCIETIDQALAEAPDFVLGHLFKAMALPMFSEQRFMGMARESLEAAEALAASANDHELAMTGAARRLIDGDWDGAGLAIDRVLMDYPRDAFTLQTGHLLDFYRGDALNLRNRVSRVMPAWSPRVPGYSYVLGMHAFGLEECNQYAEAESTARRALALQPRDGWAVHAVAHVMEMQGRIDEGIEWLETRVEDWAPDNGFAFHNWWHLALYWLDRQQNRRVLELYDRHIRPGATEALLSLVDVTALLWRLHLHGIDYGNRADSLAEAWARQLQAEKGFYAFNDFHAAMAFLLAGRRQALETLLGYMEETARSGTGTNLEMTARIGLPLCRGVLDFAEGRYQDAIDRIEPVRDVANRFGGSHAQRDVVSLTLIEAALRAGERRLARHYIHERTVHKTAGGMGWRLLARAEVADQRASDRLRSAA